MDANGDANFLKQLSFSTFVKDKTLNSICDRLQKNENVEDEEFLGQSVDLNSSRMEEEEEKEDQNDQEEEEEEEDEEEDEEENENEDKNDQKSDQSVQKFKKMLASGLLGDISDEEEENDDEKQLGGSMTDLLLESLPSRRSKKGGITEFRSMMDLEAKLSKKSTKKKTLKSGTTTIPPHINELLGKANLHFVCKEFKSAVSALTEVIRQFPALAEPYHTLSMIYEECEMNEKSLEFLFIAALLAKKEIHFWESVTKSAMKMDGKEQYAIYALSRISTLDPNNTQAPFALGKLYLKQGNKKRAALEFRKIIERNHTDSIIVDAVSLMNEIGMKEEAIDTLEIALFLKEEKPSQEVVSKLNLTNLNFLCEFYIANALYAKCLTAVDTVTSNYLKLRQKDIPVEILCKCGICQTLLGNSESGDKIFEGIVASADVEIYSDVFYDISDTYYTVSEYHKALPIFKKLLNETSSKTFSAYNKPVCLMKIADCYRFVGQHEKALILYKNVLSREPGNIEARIAMSESYKALGKMSKALSILDSNEKVSSDEEMEEKPKKNEKNNEISQKPKEDDEEDEDFEQENEENEEENEEFHVSSSEDEDDEFSDEEFVNQVGPDDFYQEKLDDEEDDRFFKLLELESKKFREEQQQLLQQQQSRNQNTEDIDSESEYTPHSSKDAKGLFTRKVDIRKIQEIQLILNRSKLCLENGDQKQSLLELVSLFNVVLLNKYKKKRQKMAEKERQKYMETILESLNVENVFKLSDSDYFNWNEGCDAFQGEENLLNSITDTAYQLAALNEVTEATRLLKKAVVAFSLLSEKSINFRYALTQISLQAEHIDEAFSHIRHILAVRPDLSMLWNLFNTILNRKGYDTVIPRFLARLLSKYPNSVPILTILGNHHILSEIYQLSIAAYMRAFEFSKDDPFINLLLGVCFLNMSMNRKTPNRHNTIIKAFNFFFNYFKIQSKKLLGKDLSELLSTNEVEPANFVEMQECNYNLARAFHQLGLFHLAIPFYEAVLNSGSAAEQTSSLVFEAAHNLGLIYQESQNQFLARKMLSKIVIV